MVESVAPGNPKGHLLKKIKALKVGNMGIRPLREQLDRIYQTYLACCRRIHKTPATTEQTVVGIYLRYLPAVTPTNRYTRVKSKRAAEIGRCQTACEEG